MSTRKTSTTLRPSSPADFKKKTRGIIELPSGLVVKVRNPGGMQAYLVNGRIPNTLLPIVQKGIKQGGVEAGGDQLEELSNDPEALADMMRLVDMMVVDAVREPEILPAPENDNERDDDLLYVDDLTEADRMFIFNWINSGVSDLAQFRK